MEGLGGAAAVRGGADSHRDLRRARRLRHGRNVGSPRGPTTARSGRRPPTPPSATPRPERRSTAPRPTAPPAPPATTPRAPPPRSEPGRPVPRRETAPPAPAPATPPVPARWHRTDASAGAVPQWPASPARCSPEARLTSSRLRTASGIASGSVAVTIHRTADRSKGTRTYWSRNVRQRFGSRTSSSASAASGPARSMASRTKTGFLTPASRRPPRMHPGAASSRPRIRRGVSSSPSVTCTVRPSAPAAATASDVLPVPPGPARHAMRTGARSVRGHTSSADPASSPPPLRGGASTVRRPPVRRLAASTSTRRLLTRSRPPWLRSSACRRWTGSNRAGACVRHGRATAIAVRSSAFSTASLPDASACWRARRSIAWTTAGSTPPARAASTRSTRGPGATSARTAPSSLGLAVPRRGHGHAGRAADSGCRRAAGSREDHRTRGPPAGGVPTTGAASTDARGDWMSRAPTQR